MTLKDALSSKIRWFCDPQPLLLVGLTPKKDRNIWILLKILFSKSEKAWPIDAIPQSLLHLSLKKLLQVKSSLL